VPVYNVSDTDLITMGTSSQSANQDQSFAMDLKNPPVVETSLGCFFAGIPGWNIIHFGALWDKFRGKYPNVEFPTPLIQNVELPATIRFEPGDQLIPIRVLFTDDWKTQLVQLQMHSHASLFLHNWRKMSDHPAYTHYDHVLPLFKKDWQTFTAFLEEHHLARPQQGRCEITYFNHLVRGEHWNTYDDLPKMFRVWHGFDAPSMFKTVEQAAFNVVQSIDKVRVNIVVSPGVRRFDGKEILQMNVTAMQARESLEDKDLFEGLNDCHTVSLKAFQSFVTDDVLKAWGAS
jgi:uncharacterized protein (TIGR04255 family)